MVTMVDLICAQCKKPFKVPLAEANRPEVRRPKYCSKECYHQSKRAGKEVLCAFCGKLVWRNNWRLAKSDLFFCSKSCKSKYLNPILLTGKKRSSYPVANKSGKWKGGIAYYGPGWAQIREQIKKDANYTCQICGRQATGRQLHIHHKKAFKDFGWRNHEQANDISNLIVVCVSCHNQLDNKIDNIIKH